MMCFYFNMKDFICILYFILKYVNGWQFRYIVTLPTHSAW